MRERVVAAAATLGLAVGLAVVAVLVATGAGHEPAPLPVLGADRAGATGAPEPALDAWAPASVRYQVDGDLEELDGEATAWSMGTDADLDRIAALAQALGLDADVRATSDGWQVRGEGGEVLDVARQPGLPWSFSATGGGGSPGSPGSPGSSGSKGSAGGDVSVPSPLVPPDDQVVCDMPECPPGTACVQVCPPDDPPPPVDLPAREEVMDRAVAIFRAGGVDVAAAEVRADRYGAWLVSADPEVGGLPTVGMASTVTIGAHDVDHASGWLAEPERGDAYRLIGTTEALRRLADGQPDQAGDGQEPVVVTVTGVRLGLELVASPGSEAAWLVPAYLFETREGGPGPDLVTFATSDDDLLPVPDPGMPEPAPVTGTA